MTRRWTRRLSVACATAGLLSVGTGAAGILSAHADTTGGSGFGAIDMTARASGVRMPLYNTGDGGEDVEGIAPYALAELSSGNVGHALTSVMWPGDTGGHGGTTLQLLGPLCVPPNPGGLVPGVPCIAQLPTPPDAVYQALNDPEKAEVQTGDKPATLSRPWGTMSASVTDDKVDASTTLLGGKELPTGDTFGETHAVSTIHLDGTTHAVVDASSVVRNIDLGGVIQIAAVVSTAHGTTDGTKGDGEAHTTISGVTIAGQPVTIDENGIHVSGQGSGLDQLQQVNTALAQSGFSIYVAKPTKTVNGAGVTLDAGSLIIRQDRPEYTGQANATGKLLVFGGASVLADAGLGYGSDLTSTPGFSAPPPADGPPAAGGATPGGGAITVPSLGSGGPAPAVAAAPAPAFAPVVAGQRSPLPGGLPAGYVVLVALGGLLAAAGLRRLPDRLFAATATVCPLGETT